MEKGWRATRGQTWHREGCCSWGPSPWPPPTFLQPPPAPTHTPNSDLTADTPIHSLFRWHKNHYKNFTKEPSGANAPHPSATETPGRGDRGERKKGESWQCWYLRGPAGRLRPRGGLEAAGPWAAQGRGSTSTLMFNPTTVLGTPGPPHLPSQVSPPPRPSLSGKQARRRPSQLRE